jgi:hypothetical protein
MIDSKPDEALFDRLRRLVQTAKAMNQCDRRSVLAMEADIRTIRSELNKRCSVLTEQMRTAGARTMAISAYARTGSIARGLSHMRPTYPTE